MSKRPVLALTVVILAAACVTAFGGDAQIEPFVPVTPEEAAITLLPAGTPGGAAELDWQARCSETRRRTAIVALGWRPAAEAAVQRVDVSKFRDGFERLRYEVSPRLADERAAVAIEGAEPGINYYWRVLTERPEGWVPSAVERFDVPVCPWDETYPDAEEEPARPGAEGARPPEPAPEGDGPATAGDGGRGGDR